MTIHPSGRSAKYGSFKSPILFCIVGIGAACAPETSAEDTQGAGGASASCQKPDEDLTPQFEFSSDARGAFPPRLDCNDLTGNAGDGPAGPGPGGGASNGGPGPGPNADAGMSNSAPLIVPPPALNFVPNEFGTNADVVMPDTEQSILADDFSVLLDTNGRHCETCHGADYSWSTTPAAFRGRFDQGLPQFSGSCDRFPTNQTATRNDDLEPIFRKRDGSNSPLADLSTPDSREAAYSLLLSRAVIRIGLPVPADADFELVAVEDPYGFASAEELSLFRRSPPMANLRFNTTLMWDGRETLPCASLSASLEQQAEHAITGHAQGTKPAHEAVEKITRAELGLYVAQLIHASAGQLSEDGANGGPYFLAQVPFYDGINAFARIDPRGRAYSSEVFSLYSAWRELPSDSERNRARAQIAEGERLFNTREFAISGVSGFNDQLAQPLVTATCGACHNTPNVGTNSEARLMDIGVSDEAQRDAQLPLYSFRHKPDGRVVKTSDPGQALISKHWSDLNRFKVPTLRGLAGRAPYLHNGSATSLEAVVDYHDQRFQIGFSAEERAALVAFLSAL